MRIDKLTTAVIDRKKGGSVSYKMERGTVGELMFVIAAGSWNYKDTITAKLRHAAGVDVVIDRIPALLLAWLCDLKKGRPSIGTGNTAGEIPEEQAASVIINPGQTFFVNSFKVPCGHISLSDAQSELEITVDVAKAFGNDVVIKIANVEPKNGPDYLLQYDKSSDLESTHLLVRELFVYGVDGKSLFKIDYTNAGVVSGKDITTMLYTENSSYEADMDLLGSNTSIDFELSHSVSNLVCAYQDHEALPTPSLRVKFTGDDVKDARLLFIKEKMIQTLTSVSTIAQVTKIQAKTEAIEKMDETVAKAYRHAGSAQRSADIADIKAELVAKTPEAK
jgi:hypothetical protein